MTKFIRLSEKSFIILGLSFFSGIFGVESLGLVLAQPIITLIRFIVWGMSSILICASWKSTIITVRRNTLISILTGLLFFSFIWSEFPDFTLFNARDIWMMTSFGLYFATRFSLKEQVKLLALNLFIGIFLSIIFALGFPDIGIHGADAIELMGAWKGVYGHKNVLGSMMVLSSVTFLLLPKDTSILYKWTGFILSVILIVLSTSKTSLVISFLLILMVNFYKNFRWQGKISIVFTNIGILILACLAVLVLTYWIELLTGLGKDPTLTGRTPLWGYALIRLMERPLLGYGRGAFWAPNSQYAAQIGQAILPGWIPPYAHNGFIDLALDVGFIGLSLFLISYFKGFFWALKQAYATKNPEKLWSLIYLIFLAMNNVTESVLLYGANLYWVLFITVLFSREEK